MKKWFICPDGEKQEIGKCFITCRMQNRCAPKGYLKGVARIKEKEGIYSVTELMKGTRETYLQRTKDYSINPKDSAWAVFGTNTHAILETAEPENGEISVEYKGITGTTDKIEIQPNGEYWLIDYKTHGSYKAMSVIGIEKTVEQKLDAEGNPEFFKNGNPKTKTVYKPNPDNADMKDLKLQLNMYRLAYEHNTGKIIHKLKVFIIVRDGNTMPARQRGIVDNIYYLDVPFMDNEDVEAYFLPKHKAIIEAMNTGNIPEMCTDEECWSGRKCEKYCDVSEFCRDIGDNKYLGEKRTSKTKDEELENF